MCATDFCYRPQASHPPVRAWGVTQLDHTRLVRAALSLGGYACSVLARSMIASMLTVWGRFELLQGDRTDGGNQRKIWVSMGIILSPLAEIRECPS